MSQDTLSEEAKQKEAVPKKWLENRKFNRMIEKARKIQMTEDEEEQHRISFAYGNLKMSRPETTREEVEEAAARLRRDKLKTISS